MICSIHNLIENHLTNEIVEIPKIYYNESTFRVSIHYKNYTCLQQAIKLYFGMELIGEKITNKENYLFVHLFVCLLKYFFCSRNQFSVGV